MHVLALVYGKKGLLQITKQMACNLRPMLHTTNNIVRHRYVNEEPHVYPFILSPHALGLDLRRASNLSTPDVDVRLREALPAKY